MYDFTDNAWKSTMNTTTIEQALEKLGDRFSYHTEVELLLTHPTGVVEMYYGTMEPAKIQIQTDSVVRSPSAKEYNAGSRLYGLVESQLMWVMDMAAVGQPLQSHVSAQLKRVT